MKRILLFFLALFLLLPLFVAQAAAASPGPSSSSVTVSSIVYGPPPATAPTIDGPTNGRQFTSSQQVVNGTCTVGLMVRVFKNSTFAGSTICASGGTYSILLNLTVGSNELVARQYDNLNQSSPDSNVVTVTYTPPKPPAGVTTVSVGQLTLVCDYSASNAFVDQVFHLSCRLTGGVAPYAISVDWGDGTSSVIVRDSQGNFSLEHTYKSAGNYLVKINGTDKEGANVYLQLAIIVNGKKDILSQITAPLYQCKPDILWPLVTLMMLLLLILITSYFIGRQRGEKLELEELREQHRLKKPPK